MCTSDINVWTLFVSVMLRIPTRFVMLFKSFHVLGLVTVLLFCFTKLNIEGVLMHRAFACLNEHRNKHYVWL